jgi:hypothetical protein
MKANVDGVMAKAAVGWRQYQSVISNGHQWRSALKAKVAGVWRGVMKRNEKYIFRNDCRRL